MLKLIGTLLVWAGVVIGSAAVLTIYQPKIDTPDALLQDLVLDRAYTLYVPDKEDPDSSVQIVYQEETQLDPQVLEDLRRGNTDKGKLERIVVNRFVLEAWSDWWKFAVGTVMMIAGAVCLRLHARREIAMMKDVESDHEASPQGTMVAIRGALEHLAEELPSLPDDRLRCDTIVARLDQVQQVHIPNFVAGRTTLIGKHGLAGFANIMDRFAALERQINRAWSSAADGYYNESAECIAQSLAILTEVEQRL